MSVSDKASTDAMIKVAGYFRELLKNMGKDSYDRVVADDTFGAMLKEAAYASSAFYGSKYNNALSRKIMKTRGKENIPDWLTLKYVSRLCQDYANGNKNFTRRDVETLELACGALIEYIEISKKGTIGKHKGH